MVNDHGFCVGTVCGFSMQESSNRSYLICATRGSKQIASQLAGPGANMLDYYQGLLMQTLAMIRLPHIAPLKKRHAYLAASLLCQRLEEW